MGWVPMWNLSQEHQEERHHASYSGTAMNAEQQSEAGLEWVGMPGRAS